MCLHPSKNTQLSEAARGLGQEVMKTKVIDAVWLLILRVAALVHELYVHAWLLSAVSELSLSHH